MQCIPLSVHESADGNNRRHPDERALDKGRAAPWGPASLDPDEQVRNEEPVEEDGQDLAGKWIRHIKMFETENPTEECVATTWKKRRP